MTPLWGLWESSQEFTPKLKVKHRSDILGWNTFLFLCAPPNPLLSKFLQYLEAMPQTQALNDFYPMCSIRICWAPTTLLGSFTSVTLHNATAWKDIRYDLIQLHSFTTLHAGSSNPVCCMWFFFSSLILLKMYP